MVIKNHCTSSKEYSQVRTGVQRLEHFQSDRCHGSFGFLNHEKVINVETFSKEGLMMSLRGKVKKSSMS